MDVGSAEYFRNLLMMQKAAGWAFVMFSADLDEVLDMSDRIAVMNQGKVTGVVEAKGANIHELATLMTTAAKA